MVNWNLSGPVGSSLLGYFLLFASVGVIFSNKDANNDRLQQLIVEVLNSTSITLRWSQPTRVGDRACPVTRYIIRLKEDGQKKPQARTWQFDGARLSVTLHDLRPATDYQVRLQSVDCEKKRKASRWTRVTTPDLLTYAGDESQVPGKATDVRTITMSESAIVTWRPPEDDVIVRGYIIGYGEGVPDVNWRYVNASQRNVTLRNLKSQTQYVISVKAFNNFGKGHVVYDIVYTKEPSAGSLPPPTQLRSRMLSSTTALLQWSDPSLDSSQRISDERYYNVYYQALPAGKNLSVIVKALQVTLYDLLPSKTYRFTVRTIKGSNTSPFSDAMANRTPSAGSFEVKIPKNSVFKDRTTTTPDYDDDYDYEIQTQTGLNAFIVSRPGAPGPGGVANDDTPSQGEPKSKRANANTIVHESLARTLTSSVNTSSMTTTQSDVKVAFRFMVQYRVSAYVTWPERLVSCPAAATADDVKMAGYLFRYKTVDDAGEYVTRNLATNFVLLENLVPSTRYKYQVKYITDRGNASAWSQEATLDTSYTTSTSLK